MSTTDHTQLQSWIRRRDADAFKDLTTRYSGLVYRTCLRITSDPGDAEDLTQECFETLACQQKAPRAPLGPWLHRVATNRALNRVKARRRRAARESDYMARRPDSTEIRWSDIDGIIDEAIADLPDDLRPLVVAHFLQNESYTSIAARLGTTRQTATNRIQKGVALIRESLQSRGIPVSVTALAALLTSNAAAAEAPVAVSAALGKLAIAGLSKTVTASEYTGAINTAAHTLGGIAAMKPSIITAGAAIVILAGGALTTKQIHGQNEELERLRTENLALATRAERADEIESELRIARAEMDRLSNRPQQDQRTESDQAISSLSGEEAERHAPSPEGDRTPEATNETDEVSGRVMFFDSALSLHATISDSTVQESQILQATADRYVALFGMLKLPGDVQGQVRAALTAHLRAQLAAGHLFSDLYNDSLATHQLRETLATLLTTEEMAVWEAFESDVPYYQAQHEFMMPMSRFIPALSDTNLSAASAVLAEEKLASQDWLNELDDLSRIDLLSEEYASLERARARLSALLSDPEQFALVDDYIQQQQAIIQARINQDEQGGLFFLDLSESVEIITAES